MTIKPRTSSETVLLVRESVAGMISETGDACLSRLTRRGSSRCRLAWGCESIKSESERDAISSKGLATYGPAVAEAEFGQQPPRGGREGECHVTGIPSSIHVEPR